MKYGYFACGDYGHGSGHGSDHGSTDAHGSDHSSDHGSAVAHGSDHGSADAHGSLVDAASSSSTGAHRMLAAAAYPEECYDLWWVTLHVFVIFFTLFGLWFWDVAWDAKYESKGLLHKLLEAGTLVALIAACAQINIIDEMTTRVEAWWWLLFFYTVVKLLWLVRFGQVALGHPIKAARLDASNSLVSLVIQMALIGAAWACVYASMDGDNTQEQLDSLEKAKLALLLISPFVVVLRAAWRKTLGGEALAAVRKEYSIPVNVGLIIHRINEFMMLMLGETVLQLVIGDIPEKSADLEDDPFAFDAVMQVGIGIKIALYDPTLDPTTDSAVNHRLQLGFSLFMTFGHQLVLKPLHQGAGSYFKPIMRNPISLVSLILRCAIYLAMLLVSLVVVPAWQYLIIQAALSLSATACHQIENWVCAMEIERAGAHAHDWTREPSMKFVDPH